MAIAEFFKYLFDAFYIILRVRMYSWNNSSVFIITWLHNELNKQNECFEFKYQYHPYIIGIEG